MRVGIIGAGFAAASHIEALRRLPNVELVGITASSGTSSAAAAQRFGIDGAFDTFSDLLAADIHVIHNCTPNHLHHAINVAALDAGKHLLSEKPLAPTSAETRDLVERAEAAKVVSGVCHNYRHFPLIRQAKAMLEGGDLGSPHLIHGTYLQDWLLYPNDWNWRLDAAQAGASRAVADIGSHWIDLVQYVTGATVARVCARFRTLHEERLKPEGEVQTFSRAEGAVTPVAIATEDLAAVLLEFDNGATGVVTISQVSPGRKNDLTIRIDTPSVGLGWDQQDPNRLWIGRRDEANSELMRDASLLAPEAAKLAHYPGGHEEGWPDALKNLIADFYAAVSASVTGEDHTPSFATFAEAHQVTKVVQAIVESNRTDGWVEVGE
jgi:predicted dehydrogenase